MQFTINPASGEPIYRQLALQIREAIARGRLQPDERVPSVREMSRRLVVNPNTIARVYGELEQEGVLVTRQGLGVFVAPPTNELTKKARRERLLARLDELLTEAVLLGFSSQEVLDAIAERAARFAWRVESV